MILLFTDFHLKKDRLLEQKKYLKKMLFFAKTKKVSKIFFLGDMFNNRKEVTPYELIVFSWFLEELEKNNIEFFGIAGNHDKPTNISEKSYLGIYKRENVKIFEKFELFYVDNFLFIPYFPEHKIIELLKNYEKDKRNRKVNYIFMHNAFNGAIANSGKKIKTVLGYEIFENMFPNLKRIFVGHYHEKNKIHEKIFYIGNPLQLNHGEKDNKGLYLFQPNKKLKFYSIPYPKYKTFILSCDAEDYLKAFDIVKNEKDSYVRLLFKDYKERLLTIPKEKIKQKSLCRGLQIEEDYIDLTKPEDTEINFEGDIIKTFEEYSIEENMTKREKNFGIEILTKNLERKND